MKKGMQGVSALVMAGAFTLAMGAAGVSANEPGYGQGGGKDGYGGGGHGMRGSHGMGMMHSSAGHLIRHLLKHEKDIGLTADQVTKLKDIQLNLDKTRIKSEADIQVAERELKALTDDEKSDLKAIESKLPTDTAMLSMTSRAICGPAVNVTVLLTVCQVCHPPVSGTVRLPVTFTPFISRWNVPPCPDDATRTSTR